MTRAGVLLLWALAASAAFAACDRPPPPRFAHLRHLQLECGGPGLPPCVTCTSCHGSLRETGRLKPLTPAACADCHDDAEPLLSVALNHAALDRRPERNVLFSHPRHLALPEVRGQCVGCHRGIADPQGSSAGLPTMDVCLECHQADFEQARCTPCHRPEHLRQLLPESFMRHDAGWLRRHGSAATRQQRVCGECHAETWCAECHDTARGLAVEKRHPERVDRHLQHRGDFLTRHAIEARSRPGTCLSCHTPQSCDSCHLQRGVSAARVGATNPHPLGWMGRDVTSRNHHGRAARQDILSCMSCHDHGAATNCVRCHAVGGPGGSPHSSSWSSARSQREVPCRYCHVQ